MTDRDGKEMKQEDIWIEDPGYNCRPKEGKPYVNMEKLRRKAFPGYTVSYERSGKAQNKEDLWVRKRLDR